MMPETTEKSKQISSMMEGPEFNSETRVLTIRFKKGSVYDYPDFEHFDEFIAAESWGKYFHAHKDLFKNGVVRSSPAPKPS
jgi:KTSC domain